MFLVIYKIKKEEKKKKADGFSDWSDTETQSLSKQSHCERLPIS